MVRTQIQLRDDQFESLRRLAVRRGVSMAAVIRESVDSVLSREAVSGEAATKRRALEAIGAFDSGLGDLSDRHDDYIAEAVSQRGYTLTRPLWPL